MANKSKSIQGSNMKQMMGNVSRELAKQEQEVTRKEDIANLHLVCEALCARISNILDITRAAEKAKKKVTKSDIAISVPVVIDYFEKNNIEYDKDKMARIAMLTNILIDIARSQINSKMSSYHVNIRQMYFSEKFYSYFGSGYVDEQDAMVEKYPQIFNTWEVANCYFESKLDGKTTFFQLGINHTSSMTKVKPENMPYNKQACDEDRPDTKGLPDPNPEAWEDTEDMAASDNGSTEGDE